MAEPDWLFIALLVGFFALLPAGVAYALVKARRAYRALADELAPLGFHAAPPGLFSSGLSGSYRGRKAKLRHVKHGKNGPWTTSVAVAVSPPDGFALRVDPEGPGAAIAKAFGGEDVSLADPAFDAKFRVRTKDRDRSSFALDADARASLTADAPWRFTVDRSHVTHHLRGRVTDPERIARTFAFAARVAERVEATR